MGIIANIMDRNIERSYDGKEGGGGKIYKIVSGISIAGMFLAAGILTLAFTGMLSFGPVIFGLMGTVFIVCLALSSSLYWIRKLELHEFKKTSIVFLILLGVCALLWTACLWAVLAIVWKAKSGVSAGYLIGLLRFVKITIIFSLQFMVASFIGVGITKYQRTMVPFQIIAYLSYLYFDFFLTLAICAIDLRGGTIGGNMDILSILGNRVILSVFILSVVYVAISNTIINSMEKRRIRQIFIKNNEQETKELQEISKRLDEQNKKQSPTEKLAKLKELLDNELITQEEYDQKRAEIIKDL